MEFWFEIFLLRVLCYLAYFEWTLVEFRDFPAVDLWVYP